MLLYFIHTSAVFHTGCWNRRKNKKTRISRVPKKEYEIEQKKPKLVRVRQWADEDDFRLFVYLKLDELIQNGQAGVEAVDEDEESNMEDNKRDNQDNRTKTVNITYINGDNSNTTTDIITDSSMNTNISKSSTTIRATGTTSTPIINTTRTTTATINTTATTNTTTTATTAKSANRTIRNTKLSTIKSSIPTPSMLLKPHNKSTNERPPTTISTLLAEITQNTDKINKKIESLILEGTRALQSDWRDFSKQDRACDNIDDVGVDLDYFAFLVSMPDAIKEIESQKGAWAVARERLRILSTFLRGLV
ncbi:8589_t:CDS:1 [Paraglomus brasilianum]|uniref:8589_t:CDS:1 n=1 Tax=Paraglomus brasilianum TaxID=144538 RepID=A0A9N9GDI1_9GLOM|nr:8589_t:CDS:1 [Paraglomus brasilianum]